MLFRSPLIKWVMRHVPQAEAAEAAAAALQADSRAGVTAPLRSTLGRHLDLRLVDPAGALPRVSSGTSLPGAR